MGVRRLHSDQPPSFAFTPDNLAWTRETIAKYPAGKAASAVIPVLWRAQEQIGGWITEPAIRAVADMLGMAYIRVYEVATFYTMFQLAPIGRKAHVQVCGTTPCMLRGSGELISVCRSRLAAHAHEVSADGNFSWEEVECLGSCANAPIVQIDKDTYEDLTRESFEALLDGFDTGNPPKSGSQTGRTASCPSGGPTSLQDPSLYDGSRLGAWKKHYHEALPTSAAPASASVAASAEAKPKASQPHPAALAAMANAGIIKELEARGGGKPLSADELERLKVDMVPAPVAVSPVKPELLTGPRGGKADDLKLIWGVAEKLEARMNGLGIWHFDQIARWTPAEVVWFEEQMAGFKGRIVRDKWQEQCAKLAGGWRPEGNVGERLKE